LDRENADITKWLEYFMAGMADSFTAVVRRAALIAQEGVTDSHDLLQTLEPLQRRTLELFSLKATPTITAKEIQQAFNYKPRTSRALLSRWTKEGFLVVLTPSKKNRTYGITPWYASLITHAIKKF
jgi:Fic family protein